MALVAQPEMCAATALRLDERPQPIDPHFTEQRSRHVIHAQFVADELGKVTPASELQC